MPEVTAEPVTPGIVETPVETQQEKPAAGADEQKTDVAADGNAEAETTEQQEEKRQSKFQRRLERQKTARIQAETRAQIAEAQLAELKAQSKPAPGSDEPQRDQFDDYESYLRAVTKYDAKQTAAETLKADREQAQGKEKQAQAATVEQETAKAWGEREKAFQGTTKDYEEVVTPFLDEELTSLSGDARKLIVGSDVGPQLLYHLASHPDVMERIADLSSVRQIAELGKLEDKLTAPVEKKTTNAPAPASHVSTGKTGQKDPAKMNQQEYRAWMKANGSRFVA